MNNVQLYNSLTIGWIEAYIKRPKAALIINAPNDIVGGLEVAHYIHSMLASSLVNNPIIKLEAQSSNSIGIADVKEFKRVLNHKADSNYEYTRFMLISEAEKMTTEAQNSLLKILEEIPEKTIIMLVVTDEKQIINTITSRCFQIKILPIPQAKAIEYGSLNGITEQKSKTAYLISEGRLNDFLAYIKNADSDTIQQIKESKKFLVSSVFERQNQLNIMYKENVDIKLFVHYLRVSSVAGMRNAKDYKAKNHWKSVLINILKLENQLDRNVSTKLAMLGLSVSI